MIPPRLYDLIDISGVFAKFSFFDDWRRGLDSALPACLASYKFACAIEQSLSPLSGSTIILFGHTV